jgi:hypothetical protein
LQLSDINQDGNIDILAGNWGLNSKLAAGKSGPLKLHVKDFDNNGTLDPILTYTIDTREYTFLPKDELEQVLPVLKKKFLYYIDFAGKEVKEVFDLSSAKDPSLEANDLASAIFFNDGRGNFNKQNLPMDLQLTPILSFQQLKNNEWLAGGNFYGVLPYEGQYDAASLVSFTIENSIVTKTKVLEIKGETRDIKKIRTKNNGEVLLVGMNNDSLKFYKQK